jgi:sugar lactone lactonase YvrE
MLAPAIAILAALWGCTATEEPPTSPDTTTSDPSTDTSGTAHTGTDDTAPADTSTTPTGTTGSTGSTGSTGDTAEPFDCSAPWPSTPISVTTLTGYTRAEDFDFDADGYAVSASNGNLIGKDQYGNTKVISPSIGDETAGTRVLSTGDWVVADVGGGAIVRVTTATGAQEVLLAGLAYPNGLEVDEDDNVYIGENYGDRVVRVNAYDPSDVEVVAQGLREPNGVILSPDGQTLYVGSFGGGKIYAVDRDPKGGWLPFRTFYDPTQRDQGFDGINVDACGNVYITEFTNGKVYRISPDGTQAGEVADLPSFWIPNLRWGVGVGGWDADTLYVSDRAQGRIFAIDVGIPGKPHILAP